MTQDNENKQWQERIALPLMVAAVLISIAGLTLAGYGTIAYLVFALALLPFLLHPSMRKGLYEQGFDNRDIAGFGFFALVLLIAIYFEIIKNPLLSTLFAILAVLPALVVLGNKARQTAGRVRIYYLAYIFFFVSIIFVPQGFAAIDPGFVSALRLVSLFIVAVNQTIVKEYWRARRQWEDNQQLLDTPKADPFYGEQPRPDKVKDWR